MIPPKEFHEYVVSLLEGMKKREKLIPIEVASPPETLLVLPIIPTLQISQIQIDTETKIKKENKRKKKLKSKKKAKARKKKKKERKKNKDSGIPVERPVIRNIQGYAIVKGLIDNDPYSMDLEYRNRRFSLEKYSSVKDYGKKRKGKQKKRRKRIIFKNPKLQSAYDKQNKTHILRQKKNKKKDISPLKAEYNRHIHSSVWKNFRKKILEERDNKCEKCGYTRRLHLHHLNYDNFGHELPEDVQVLCNTCHEKVHNKAKKK